MKYRQFCEIKKCILFYFIFLFLFVVNHKKDTFFKKALVRKYVRPASTPEQLLYGTSGYMMTCAIPEQLESAMYELHQFADLAESWGLKIGEPKVSRSTFEFALSRNYHWKLRNIYNITDLKTYFRKDFNIDYDLIIPSQDILSDQNLGSDIAFIQWTKKGALSSKECFIIAFSSIRKCFKNTPLNHMTSKLRKSVICLKECEKINFRDLIHNNPILNQMSERNKRNGTKFMVIFSSWNGVRTTPTNFFFWDPEFHQRNYNYVHAILHSKEVKITTKEFKEGLNLKPVFIGIHIRLEKIIRRIKLLSVINKCIDKLEFEVKRAKKKQLESSFVAFTDYKWMGSGTCYKLCKDIARKLGINKRLRSLGVVVNPDLKTAEISPLKKVSGFVANVEQELLSQADFLILTGTGKYQVGIVKRFMRYHNIMESSAQERIVKICNFSNPSIV